MSSKIFEKLNVFFAAIFLLNQISDSIDVDNYPDSITNSSFKYENLSRNTRQNNQKCRIPHNPPHTKYKFAVETETKHEPGDYAKDYDILEIICDNEYNIEPFAQNYSICTNDKWYPPLTKCLRTCPSLTSVTSTNVNCKWNDPDGFDIPLRNCINPVEGTTVLLSCNSFYEEASIKRNPIRICIEGKWDPPVPVCYPICGLKRPEARTNIINGVNAEPGDYPWQVGVYNPNQELICGGSILDYRVILSAAHCFTDYNGNVKSPENYFIAAGKYYRKYTDDRDKFAQFSKVKNIHVPSRYKGTINFEGFDIAIVILADPFEISLRIQPVCIELDEESQDLHLSINKVGIVTGWGYTHNGRELSEVLKEVLIPYIPYDKCFATVPSAFRRYITHDKICGGYINNDTSVCGGDSGGGLVFKKLNSDQHYIKGIVSVSPATVEKVCDSNQYSVYTEVVHYIGFVRKLLRINQIRTHIECTQDDCLNEKFENITIESHSNTNDNNFENMKNNCQLPNFPPNGEYILNQNDDYKPGDYVKSKSLLSLACDTGFGLSLSDATQSYCSDTGEWTPSPKECIRETTTTSCITPNNERAICKLISKCEVIQESLSSGTIEANIFAQKSQCGNANKSFVCCGSSGLPSLIYQHQLLPRSDVCGIQNLNYDDVEGTVQVDEFPWMALIIQFDEETSMEYFGRGSLISSRYVLTTAYLLTRYSGNLLLRSVRLGVHGFSELVPCEDKKMCSSSATDFGIESVIVHPSYSWNLRLADIALLRLNASVEFTDSIRPICLPTSSYSLPVHEKLWLSGWEGLESGKTSKVKIKGKISVLSKSECNQYGIRLNGTFCAVTNNSVTRRSLCLGDLAGPAVRRIPHTSKNQWVQEGLCSFTYIVCNSSYYRGLYTNVSEYMEWIINSIF